jgi:site-specific DNA-methyltransferase (adenine-specific)
MQWLCRLITPPGGTVLDCFCGSGSTGIAALREHFGFVGIELDPGYVEIAKARIVGDAPLINSTLEDKPRDHKTRVQDALNRFNESQSK